MRGAKPPQPQFGAADLFAAAAEVLQRQGHDRAAADAEQAADRAWIAAARAELAAASS